MQYDFGYNHLNDVKTNSLLVWHSDCYYNPDDIISVSSLSCLHIKLEDGIYKLWCDKEINKLLNLNIDEFCIGFSPCVNGRYVRNIKTGSTLQDDFVIMLYQRLFLEDLKEKLIIRKIIKDLKILNIKTKNKDYNYFYNNTNEYMKIINIVVDIDVNLNNICDETKKAYSNVYWDIIKDNSEDEEGEGHMMNNSIMMDLASKLLYENPYDKLNLIKDNL